MCVLVFTLFKFVVDCAKVMNNPHIALEFKSLNTWPQYKFRIHIKSKNNIENDSKN